MERGAGQPGDPTDGPSVGEVQSAAARAGLSLTEDEARQLLAGVRRVRAMAAEVRALASSDVEPSGPQVAPWPARPR